MMETIDVSVIIVTRNEERYIESCIQSVCNQFRPGDKWELIVVDGCSTDLTVKKAIDYLELKNVNFKILKNEKKMLSTGWNIGLKNANGTYVVRPDAHSRLHDCYIKTGICILNKRTDVDVVGGRLATVAKGFWGSIIKDALSSKTGVGNSSFRTGKKDGITDTAVYGIYRKQVFEKVGVFNESLIRHQDNEMHKRIKDSGGKFYFCTDMKADYYCRDNILKLLKQMFLIGFYLPDAGLKSFNARHFAPMIFVISIFFCSLLAIFLNTNSLLLFFIMLYEVIILLELLIRCFNKKKLTPLFNLFIIPMMHLAYGAGTIFGLCKYIIIKKEY
jgi:glycosyltransferase involved in cell wall biosynthesis